MSLVIELPLTADLKQKAACHSIFVCPVKRDESDPGVLRTGLQAAAALGAFDCYSAHVPGRDEARSCPADDVQGLQHAARGQLEPDPPVLLACGHILSSSAGKSIAATSQGSSFSCPLCRTPVLSSGQRRVYLG